MSTSWYVANGGKATPLCCSAGTLAMRLRSCCTGALATRSAARRRALVVCVQFAPVTPIAAGAAAGPGVPDGGSAVDHLLHGFWVAIALDLHAG